MATKLYGVLRSRASRNAWFLKELGIPYERVPVIQAYRLPDRDAPGAPLHTASPAFLAVNPNGQIPALDDGGVVLTESLAINLYLARKRGGPLAPRDVTEDGLATQWSLWAATAVEPHAINIVYFGPGGSKGHDRAIHAAAVLGLRAPFAVLDRALEEGGGFLVGRRFTVADVNVAEVIRYAMGAPDLFEAAPNVRAWLAACHARPAFKAMMEAREAEPA